MRVAFRLAALLSIVRRRFVYFSVNHLALPTAEKESVPIRMIRAYKCGRDQKLTAIEIFQLPINSRGASISLSSRGMRQETFRAVANVK